MTGKEKKEKRWALLAGEIAADPAVLRGKRLTAILLVLWIAAHLLFFIAHLICAKTGYFDFDMANVALFVLVLFCAALLNRGVKNIPFLLLLGGVILIVVSFRERAYLILGLDLYLDLKLYYFSLVLAAWLQIAVMLCLLLIPCCVRYAEALGRIREDLSYKGYRPGIPVSRDPENKDLRQKLSRMLVMLLNILAGALCALLYIRYGKALTGLPLLNYLLIVILMFFAVAVQIAIHEAGHLVFGLLTGYRFSSYRIFGLMWIRQNGRLRLRRLKLAGTGGQCLMAPPDWREDLPCVLYNLGGVLLNLISAVLFWLLARIVPPFVKPFLLIPAIYGLLFALTNGLPLRSGWVDNDARNILFIRRSRYARRAFWLQLKITERTAAGELLRDMPEEWFSVPGDEEPENSLIAAVAFNRAQRLMEERRFEEAASLQDRLLRSEILEGNMRCALRCDRMTCELLGEGDGEVLSSLLPREQLRFFWTGRNNPSVLRTEIALVLLRDRDSAAADKLRAAFEKAAAIYPYPAVIEFERELLALIEEKAAG